MQGTRLDSLLTARPSLRPGEVVTVVAAIAGQLSAMHAAGQVHGAVSAERVVVDGTGRPRLQHPPVEPSGAEGRQPRNEDVDADVRALASLASQQLGPYPPQQLVWTLEEATTGGVTAEELATRVLAACRAEPVRQLRSPQPPVGVAPEGVGQVDWVTRARGVPRPRRRRVTRRRLLAAVAGQRRLLVVVGAAVCLVLVGALVWTRAGSTPTAADDTEPPTATEPGRSAAATGGSPSPSASRSAAAPRWEGVLDRLDNRRAAAFAAGDLDMLRRVYVPGSAAFDADAATLRAYTRQGLRVRGLRLRVSAVREVSVSVSRARLRVADRLLPYRVVDGDGQVRRERGREAVTWVVTLRRFGGEWRVASTSRV